MSFELAWLVAEARSSCSTSMTRRPRPAASRAIPAPLMPPPMTSRSKAMLLCAVIFPESPPHQAQGCLRVGNDTVTHPFERVVQAGREGLEVLAHVELRADMTQVACAVQVDRLGRIADRRMQRRDLPPVRGLEPAFLDELALRRGERRFVGLELARGQLDEVAALRVAVLALEEDGVGVDEREHHHRARMHDIFAPGRRPVRQADRIAHHLEQPAVIGDLRRDRALGEIGFELWRFLLFQGHLILIALHRTRAEGRTGGPRYRSTGRDLATALPLEFLALLRSCSERGTPLSAFSPRVRWRALRETAAVCAIVRSTVADSGSLPR